MSDVSYLKSIVSKQDYGSVPDYLLSCFFSSELISMPFQANKAE